MERPQWTPLLNLVARLYSAVNPPPLFTPCNRGLHGWALKRPRRLLLPPAPIKSRGPCPVLTTPVPALLPSSSRLSITTSEPLRHHRSVIVARPSHRLSILGDRRIDFTVLPSSRLTLNGELPSPGAVGGQALVSALPRSGGLQFVPPGGVTPRIMKTLIKVINK
jgi:hypothetical protein